ncbi:hypothetical protein Dsin_013197 [Dipteronia sinensis]|uniref:FAS1 domain-containing protein n=1 Tax=Dipteronia sinensis TaxID=43782 RepID=A0AAE0AJM1_9ROSI|nr:hypothetical protein Dsin_013197 [Dipteronia sinensis]
MSSSKHLSLFFSFFFLISSSASALNITDILSKYPEFSTFSNLLVQTKVGDAINSRQTITVLVVNNGAFSSLSGEPDNVVKNILSLHVILDYFDQQKIQKLEKKTALLTTLFQSSGQAKGQQGFLNVTNLSDGSIAFGSAVPGAELKSKFEKAVTSQPYNISILQVSSVIAPPGMVGNSNSNSNSSSNSNSNSNSTTENQSSNLPSPAGSPTKTPAPGASPEKPPANNATSTSPNPAKKESPENSPEKAPTPSDAGKSPEKAPTPSNSKVPTPSKSKAPTPSKADSPDASSPTSAEEPAAAETPTSPTGSPPEPGSSPEPAAGGASGPAAESPSAGSLAAPIDGLMAGALAVIFASTWSLF